MENSEDAKAPASPRKEAAKEVSKEVSKAESEETKAKPEESTPAPADVEMSDAAPTNDDAKPAEDTPVESEAKPVEAEDSEMTDKPAEKPDDNSDKPDDKSDDKPDEKVDEKFDDKVEDKPDEKVDDEPNDKSEATPAEDSTPVKVNGNTDVPSSDPLPGSEVDLQPASLSQLAIESEPAKPSIEVTMQDAPAVDSAPNVKIAREREDDGSDEPAPKRARTEPKEENAMDVVPTASAPADPPSQTRPSGLSGLRKWDDASINVQVLTQFQRREIRKVLGRVKKTKQGMHFRDSVQKLWPVLWESYVAKIERPTDLSDIDRTLRDPAGLYKTMGDFKQDLLLMYENTLSYNGPIHEVTQAAKGCIKNVWEDVLTIPQEEISKPKPAPKQKPPREPRMVPHPEPVVRKPSTLPGSPVVTAPPKPTPPREPASDVRRASSATEGDRPKRTVRPPKAKDIDYSTKPSRKKMKPELQFCEEVLSELMAPKNQKINSWFMEAVDAEGLAIPQYYSIIKKPMDLGKVSRMLSGGEITSLKDFDKTVRLIFGNCYTFNGSPDQNAVSYVAKQLEDHYASQMKQKDSWLAKHAKANAPPPPAYASDEEDDEEEEAEDVPPAGVDHVKEVRELEAKLREESEKLNDLFAADSPNSSLINVQQGILRMVQEALLKAKTTQSEFRQKSEKSSKKSSKPAKSKSSSGGARKPSNTAHPKKSGGTKKAVKKNLSAADKDAIANAINDLEYPHLDRAIDIIKRDTGQNVSSQCRQAGNQLTLCRKTIKVNLSWILTNLVTRPSSSCGNSAKRSCQALVKTRQQFQIPCPRSIDQARQSRRRTLPSPRRISP